jgi:hypothetical protein
MTSTLPKGTFGSVASLLAAILYQGHTDRNHKLWRLGDIVDRIYPIELEIKDTANTNRSASYLDLYIEIDSECRLRTKPYDKTDDFFNFTKSNPWFSSFIVSSNPLSRTY